MTNQRVFSPKAEDGRPAVHLRPGAAVADFPVTAQTGHVTSSAAVAEDGAVLIFSTQDFYLTLDGSDATTTDMRYPGSQLVVVAVKSGDVVSIEPTASADIHAHYAA
jgi:hypothetical protein